MQSKKPLALANPTDSFEVVQNISNSKIYFSIGPNKNFEQDAANEIKIYFISSKVPKCIIQEKIRNW